MSTRSYKTEGAAIVAAQKHSARDRCTCYVLLVAGAVAEPYYVGPCGAVAPWETLLHIFDCGEKC